MIMQQATLQLVSRTFCSGRGGRFCPPYSSDLSPCNFDLIPKLETSLCGKLFENREDILTGFQREVVHIMYDIYDYDDQ